MSYLMKKSLPSHSRRDMRRRLLEWGYEATQEACRAWFSLYRLVSGGIDGHALVFILSRIDLRNWYYIDNLSATQIQRKYLLEHGVNSHRNNLMYWLQAEAQKPDKLEFNESIHSHPSGEFVLQQLQNGIAPQVVVSQLMGRYLVEAS